MEAPINASQSLSIIIFDKQTQNDIIDSLPGGVVTTHNRCLAHENSPPPPHPISSRIIIVLPSVVLLSVCPQSTYSDFVSFFSLPKALEWCRHACLSSQTPGRLPFPTGSRCFSWHGECQFQNQTNTPSAIYSHSRNDPFGFRSTAILCVR